MLRYVPFRQIKNTMQPFMASQSRDCRNCFTKWFQQFLQDAFTVYQLLKSGQLTYKSCLSSVSVKRFLVSLCVIILATIYLLPRLILLPSTLYQQYTGHALSNTASINTALQSKLQALSNLGSASTLENYFTKDVESTQLDFFQHYNEEYAHRVRNASDPKRHIDGENFLYYANFIQHHTLDDSPPLLGNGALLCVYKHADVTEQTKQRIKSLLSTQPLKNKDTLERFDEIKADELARLVPFEGNGEFSAHILLNTTEKLSSITSIELPLTLGVQFKHEKDDHVNSMTRLSLKTGEVDYIRQYPAGIYLSQRTFAHRQNLELLSQTFSFTRYGFKPTFSAASKPQKFLQIVSPMVSPLQSKDISSQYTEDQSQYRLFSGIIQRDMTDGRVMKIGIVVVQEKLAQQALILKTHDMQKTVTLRTLVYNTKLDFNQDMVAIADQLSSLRERAKTAAVEIYKFGLNVLDDALLKEHDSAWDNLYHTNIELRYHKAALLAASEATRKTGLIRDMMHKFHALNEHHDASYLYDYDGIPAPDGSEGAGPVKQDADKSISMPSALQINTTVYMLMSFFESSLDLVNIGESERLRLKQRLHTPEYCYHSHPTAHVKSLWHAPKDGFEFAKIWALTLEKQGCKTLLSEGGEGLLQALVLSFSGLQFHESHLELDTDPDLLHSSFSLHSVFYDNVTLDFQIISAGERLLDPSSPYYLKKIVHAKDATDEGMSYESLLIVKSHGTSLNKLYLCGAGCKGSKYELSPDNQVQIPIFITNPVTPIVYISRSKEHLSELGSTLHINHIVEHAEHLENKRKKSKSERKRVGTFLWISIVMVIVLFHVFLVRLIFSEYQQWNQRHMQYEAMKPYYSRPSKMSF